MLQVSSGIEESNSSGFEELISRVSEIGFTSSGTVLVLSSKSIEWELPVEKLRWLLIVLDIALDHTVGLVEG